MGTLPSGNASKDHKSDFKSTVPDVNSQQEPQFANVQLFAESLHLLACELILAKPIEHVEESDHMVTLECVCVSSQKVCLFGVQS